MTNNNNNTIKLRNYLIFSGIVAAIMFGLSAWAWGQIPADAQIPVHWGINGEPDRYGGKFEGLLLMPIIITAVAILLAIVPRIEPDQERADVSRRCPAHGESDQATV